MVLRPYKLITWLPFDEGTNVHSYMSTAKPPQSNSHICILPAPFHFAFYLSVANPETRGGLVSKMAGQKERCGESLQRRSHHQWWLGTGGWNSSALGGILWAACYCGVTHWERSRFDSKIVWLHLCILKYSALLLTSQVWQKGGWSYPQAELQHDCGSPG